LSICKNGARRPHRHDSATKTQETPLPGRLIGYARVSTEDQGTDPQRDELQAAGCASILEEHASCRCRSGTVIFCRSFG
jgi:predicted site-specific integrase-resolvase